MSDFRLILSNLREFKAEMGKSQSDVIKAAERATKIEAFRLRTELKKELKAGAPGGIPLAPLREITTRTAKRNPLASFHKAVRYEVIRRGKAPYRISIGFLSNWVSRTWVVRAGNQQVGFEHPIFPNLRETLATYGAYLEKKGDWRSILFFLRADKTKFKTPAREMIDPFWGKHQSEVPQNIISNFEKKLRGEWIQGAK